MNKLEDNFPKEHGAPSAPDRGANTGVSDTYGSNLTTGLSEKSTFDSAVPSIHLNPGCDPKSR